MFDLEDAKKRGCVIAWNDGDRWPARVICADLKGLHALLVAAVRPGETTEGVWRFALDGSGLGSGRLENLPLEREVWVAACAGNYIAYHDERGASDMAKCWRAQGAPSGYAKVTIPLTK